MLPKTLLTRSISPASALWIGLFLCVTAPRMSSGSPVVPGQMSYQGYLRNASAQPVSRDDVAMQFFIFNSPTGNESCWGPEDHFNVSVVDGFFELTLGETVPIPESCFDGSVKWLETRVDGVPLTPRKPLGSVPYALAAPTPAGMGVPVFLNFNTTYHAETDGFVTGLSDPLDAAYIVSVHESPSDPPTTLIQLHSGSYVPGQTLTYGISFPVKKGYYWRVDTSALGHGGSLYFFSFGQ